MKNMKNRRKPLGTMNVIGIRITELRRIRRMKQKDLVLGMRKMGVEIDPSGLSKLEGQTRTATDREIYAIAKVLDVQMENLFPDTIVNLED